MRRPTLRAAVLFGFFESLPALPEKARSALTSASLLCRLLLMSSAYSKHPTQPQILRALKRVPALQRDEVIASTCLGRRVYWQTRFFDALDIGQYDVKQFSFTQRGWHRFSRFDRCIYAHISIERHPETRQLRRGRRVDLYGAIANVDTALAITLALDRFEILPLSFLDRWVQGEDSRI
jgi:hypothetical protein